jgi:hypothetical protein
MRIFEEEIENLRLVSAQVVESCTTHPECAVMFAQLDNTLCLTQKSAY